jgi:hypothetical protein
MTRLRFCSYGFHLLSKLGMTCLVFCGFAYGQLLNQDEEIQVHNLPALMARTHDPSDVLLTSLDTVIHDREVCCGKDSALEDSALAADPKSLKDVAGKLDGRHLLSDGRPIVVKASYLTPDAVNSGLLITWFQNQHAALMQWNSHLYVVHGIVYLWTASGGDPTSSGMITMTVIHKFLLWDMRYSDSRREVVFNRESDDPNQVQGLLFVEFKPQ